MPGSGGTFHGWSRRTSEPVRGPARDRPSPLPLRRGRPAEDPRTLLSWCLRRATRDARRRLGASYHARIQSSCFSAPALSDPGQAGLDALVPLIGGPEIERQRDEVVHLGDRARVEREIDRLHVPFAGVARLDPHRGFLLVLERGEEVRIGFAARGAADAREVPLPGAQGTVEEALRAVRLGEDLARGHPGQPSAEWAAALTAAAARLRPPPPSQPSPRL